MLPATASCMSQAGSIQNQEVFEAEAVWGGSTVERNLADKKKFEKKKRPAPHPISLRFLPYPPLQLLPPSFAGRPSFKLAPLPGIQARHFPLPLPLRQTGGATAARPTNYPRSKANCSWHSPNPCSRANYTLSTALPPSKTNSLSESLIR